MKYFKFSHPAELRSPLSLPFKYSITPNPNRVKATINRFSKSTIFFFKAGPPLSSLPSGDDPFCHLKRFNKLFCSELYLCVRLLMAACIRIP